MTSHMATMSGVEHQSYFSIDNFRQTCGALLDIRSPAEFNQGHWPGAINLPLFNNDERAKIGKMYKKEGRQKAVMLGLKLTGPKLLSLKKNLEALSKLQSSNNKEKASKTFLRLYCWRGGMRSASVGWLANLLNLNPVILEGGYKNYRKWVLQKFQYKLPLRLIGGRTGTGKTDLLLSMANKGISTIDLEGLANHRGSSFGGLGLPTQPTSEHYENLLAETLEICDKNTTKGIWIESESANLGRCRIPNEFFKQMKTAPLLQIDRSKEERIMQLVKVYAKHDKNDLKEATNRISRRLGPQRTTLALKAIENEQWEEACSAMLDYYDRCYEYELEKSPHRETIDITGLTPDVAASKLLTEGLIY